MDGVNLGLEGSPSFFLKDIKCFNFSKLLEALNEVLKDAGVTKKINRVTAENPSNPFIYLDSAEQSVTHLKRQSVI